MYKRTLSEIKKVQSMKSKKEKHLKKDIRDIFEIILPIGKFNHNIEKEPKLLFKAQNFLLCFLNGTIYDEYGWAEKMPMGFVGPKEIKQPSDIYKLLSMLKKACSRFATMKTSGYWPPNKSKLPKSIDDFLYNSQEKKSWFFYCLKNQPKEMNTVVGDKIQEQTLKQIPDERDRQAAIEYKKPNWNISIYWHKILELHEWIQKYGPVLYAYNQEGPTSIYFLLEEIKEFQSTWTEWSLSNFGYGNKTWTLFVKWMKEKKNIDLDPDKDMLRTKLSEFGWTEKEMEKLK